MSYVCRWACQLVCKYVGTYASVQVDMLACKYVGMSASMSVGMLLCNYVGMYERRQVGCRRNVRRW